MSSSTMSIRMGVPSFRLASATFRIVYRHCNKEAEKRLKSRPMSRMFSREARGKPLAAVFIVVWTEPESRRFRFSGFSATVSRIRLESVHARFAACETKGEHGMVECNGVFERKEVKYRLSCRTVQSGSFGDSGAARPRCVRKHTGAKHVFRHRRKRDMIAHSFGKAPL